jgi:hypothetical protein
MPPEPKPSPQIHILAWRNTDRRYISLKRRKGPRRIDRFVLSEDEIQELLLAIRKAKLDPDFWTLFDALHIAIRHQEDCFNPDGEVGICVCSKKQLKARAVFEDFRERFRRVP